jgi:hypothetical protein
MEIIPVGSNPLENQFTLKLAQIMQYDVTINDFYPQQDEINNIDLDRVGGIDREQYGLNPSNKYFISPEIARKIKKNFV